MSQTKYYDLMEHVIIVHQINNRQHQRENVKIGHHIYVQESIRFLTIMDIANNVLSTQYQTRISENVFIHIVFPTK